MSVLVSVGNAVIDVTARVPALPERGGDVLASSSGLSVGGAGFNVLVAAARQGLAGRYAGAHGTGPLGELVRAALQREGVGVLLPPVPGADTGFDVALTDAGGERTFITAVGAETQLRADRLAGVAVSPDDLVHVSGYSLLHPGSREAIAAWLPTLPADTVVLFDPGPLAGEIPPGILTAVMRRATWWSGTLAEAITVTGMDERASEPVETAAAAARRIAAGGAVGARTNADTGAATGGAMGVIVRLGADGCVLLVPGAEPAHMTGIPAELVDSNGAGDAHVGAFLAALAAGAHPLDAARRANAAAAFTVTRSGPATAPTSAEVDALLASTR